MVRIGVAFLVMAVGFVSGVRAQEEPAAQSTESPDVTSVANSAEPEPLPDPADLSDPPPLPPLLTSVAAESLEAVKSLLPSSHHLTLGEYWGYRTNESSLGWMVGNGDQFGDVYLGSNHYIEAGVGSGLRSAARVHMLSGPDQTDMPPLLWDFSLGYQRREIVGELTYDVACSVLAASDFEGSSRDGVMFPAHAVGYLAFNETVDLVFGADFLDREDIRLLPVGGVLWRPTPEWRLELVFPAPRIDWQITEDKRLYLRGGLGGGTWAVERDNELDDLATYFDLQVALGLGDYHPDQAWSSFEIAYLFDRELQYRSGDGDYRPNATVMVRSVTKY